jgi:fatty acid kinase fatty acid binding subunit
MTVAVLTDSASALPAAVAAAHGVMVVPMWLEIDGRSVHDGDAALVDVLTATTLTTAGPSPGEFAAALEQALDGAPAAVVPTVTAGVSSTHAAAVLGAAGFGERVRVLDTGSAAGGQALVVLAAAAAAQGGASLEEVVARAQAVAAKVRMVGALAGSAHLARGGRVPGVAARTADRLGVRPLFQLHAGKVRGLRPARGDGDMVRMERLCLTDRPEPAARLHAVVMHADAPDRAESLCLRLHALAPHPDALVTPFGAAMVAHTGPGLLGLAWWWD